MTDKKRKNGVPDRQYVLADHECTSVWELNKKLKGVVSLLTELREELNGTDRNIVNHETRINHVCTLVDNDRKSFENLTSSISVIKAKCENFHDEIGTNLQCVETMKVEQARVRKEFDTLEKRHVLLVNGVDRLRSTVDQNETSIHSDVNDLKTRCDELDGLLQKHYESFDRERFVLKDQVEQLALDYKSLANKYMALYDKVCPPRPLLRKCDLCVQLATFGRLWESGIHNYYCAEHYSLVYNAN
jgi:chromosome segregation ATPase